MSSPTNHLGLGYSMAGKLELGAGREPIARLATVAEDVALHTSARR